MIRRLAPVEILWWLAPPVVVAIVAMLWVGWLGRERTVEVDREAAAARLARALESGRPITRHATAPPPRDRSRGIAVRPSRVSGADERRAG